MNGLIVSMALIIGMMVGVLFSTPIKHLASTTYVYANGVEYDEEDDEFSSGID